MQIISRPCGAYATNCYILKAPQGDIVIDPGQGAFDFVRQNSTRVLAVLNTHGHFDHIWDNGVLREAYGAPIYIHKDDEFMLKDPFAMGHPHSNADFLVSGEDSLDIKGLVFRFLHFPGHTPGCCMIELVGENLAFSGDFLFKGSIGRYDFPYSDANLMRQSLEKAAKFTRDLKLLPGHGEKTTLKAEQRAMGWWLNAF